MQFALMVRASSGSTAVPQSGNHCNHNKSAKEKLLREASKKRARERESTRQPSCDEESIDRLSQSGAPTANAGIGSA